MISNFITSGTYVTLGDLNVTVSNDQVFVGMTTSELEFFSGSQSPTILRCDGHIIPPSFSSTSTNTIPVLPDTINIRGYDLRGNNPVRTDIIVAQDATVCYRITTAAVSTPNKYFVAIEQLY